jgi:FkbM family methyltransferase
MWLGQNQEDRIIKEYFGSRIGSLLSIGENDGVTYSNSRNLILEGWGGVLVEPAPEAFKRLSKLYEDPNIFSDVILVNKAICHENGKVKFYDSGEHAIRGTTSLLSTVKPSEMDRWPGVPFEEKEVDCITVESLLNDYCPIPMFDLIMIDCEGFDYDILCQLNFTNLYTSCVCVEWNSIDGDKYDKVMFDQGFKLIHTNRENKIYGFVK